MEKTIPEKFRDEIKLLFSNKNIFFTSYTISDMGKSGLNGYEYVFKMDFVLKNEYINIAEDLLKQETEASNYDIFFTKYKVNKTHTNFMVLVELNKKNIRELKLKKIYDY